MALLQAGSCYTLDGVEHRISHRERFSGAPPVLTEKKLLFLTQLKQICKHFHTVCERKNILYYLCCGTLLGALKVKGILPWDTDADVSVPYEEINKIEQAFNEGPYKLIPFRYGYKLCVKEFPHYPFLDIMVVDINPAYKEKTYAFSYPLRGGLPSFEMRWFFNKKKHPVGIIFPLRRYEFEGFEMWGPGDGEEVCVLNYGRECLGRSFVKGFNKHWITPLIRM